MPLRVGDKLTGNGVVTAITVSPYGLHTAVIECEARYPSLQSWLKMLGKDAIYHDYKERMIGHMFIGRLILQWKE